MIVLLYLLIPVRLVMPCSLFLRKSIRIDFKIPITAVGTYHILPKFLFLVFRRLLVKAYQIFFCKIPRRICSPVYILLLPVISSLSLSACHRKKYLLRRIDLIMPILKVKKLRRMGLFLHDYIFSVRKILRYR